jgi:hypothetical protein
MRRPHRKIADQIAVPLARGARAEIVGQKRPELKTPGTPAPSASTGTGSNI